MSESGELRTEAKADRGLCLCLSGGRFPATLFHLGSPLCFFVQLTSTRGLLAFHSGPESRMGDFYTGYLTTFLRV
jgi:hypothetical protein